MRIQFLAPHAGLNDAVEILGVDREDRVHPREVDADPAENRKRVALDRRTRAERYDRHAGSHAQPHAVGDFLGRRGKDDRVRQGLREMRLARAVLAADALAHRQRVAETLAKRRDERLIE